MTTPYFGGDRRASARRNVPAFPPCRLPVPLRRSRVAVAARAEEGRLVVEVRDDGPGLRAEDAATALARGGRLDQTTPGHGLGLAIVAEAVEAYGGSLSFHDRSDAAAAGGSRSGLTVRLTLPLGA